MDKQTGQFYYKHLKKNDDILKNVFTKKCPNCLDQTHMRILDESTEIRWNTLIYKALNVWRGDVWYLEHHLGIFFIHNVYYTYYYTASCVYRRDEFH